MIIGYRKEELVEKSIIIYTKFLFHDEDIKEWAWKYDGRICKRYMNSNWKLHRKKGPAQSIGVHRPLYRTADGVQEYFLNGKRHNKNGPAMIFPPSKEYKKGNVEYYVNDIRGDSLEDCLFKNFI